MRVKQAGHQHHKVRATQIRAARLAILALVLGLAACSSTASAPVPAVTIPVAPPSTTTVDATTSIVYGLEHAAAGVMPTEAGCDVVCRQLLQTIADPLLAVSAGGDVVPMLLSSIEPADDYFTWVLTLREGVNFHDDTALDGPALAEHIDRCRFSPLTSAWFAPISAVEANELTVTLHLAEPWLSFPQMLASHPCAFPVKGTVASPIGTGPFEVAASSAGTDQAISGDGLRVERFDGYWRGESGTGEGLPLVDQIEFTVQPSLADRERLLAEGVLDLFHSSAQVSDHVVAQSTLATDTYQLVFNVAERPVEPNALDTTNEACRSALAAATDRSLFSYAEHLEATGPFGPNQIGYLERITLPDPADPEPLFSSCLGTVDDPITLRILMATDEPSERIAASLVNQWSAASDRRLNIEIETADPAELARRALYGDFDALLWRNAGGLHPEANFPWWHSSSVQPVGTYALNVGRFADQTIDEALKSLRVDPLPLAQQFAAEEITRSFDRSSVVLWLEWTEWSVAASTSLEGFDSQVSPDGTVLAPLLSGAHPVANLSCSHDTCN